MCIRDRLQVDTRQAADPGKARLRRGDVHYRKAAVLYRTRNISDDLESGGAGARLQRDGVALTQAQRFPRRRTEEDAVVGQRCEAPCPGGRSGQQRRCYRCLLYTSRCV